MGTISTVRDTVTSPQVWLNLFAVAAIVWLGVENLELRRASLGRLPAREAAPILTAGDTLPSGMLARIDGRPEDVAQVSLGSIAEGPSVVFFVASTCPYCTASVPLAAKLAAKLEGKGVTFVSVMLDGRIGDTEQISAYPLPLVPFAPVDDSSLQTMSVISRVPTLVLSGATGTVMKSWSGQLSEATASEILAAAELVGKPRAVGANGHDD